MSWEAECEQPTHALGPAGPAQAQLPGATQGDWEEEKVRQRPGEAERGVRCASREVW